MKNQFADYGTSKKLKELGFNEECIASYQQMQYPINDSGNDYNKSLCLTIDCEMPHDEQKVLWIEKENAHFHWNEGNYENGEHSRCELEGEDCKAPIWKQVKEWLWEKHGIYLDIIQIPQEESEWIFQASICNNETCHDSASSTSPITAEIEGIKKAVEYLSNSAVAVTPINTNANGA